MQYSAARNTKGLTGRQAILLTRRFASRLPTEFYPLCSQGWNTAQFEDISFHIVCNDVRLRLLKKLTLLIIESCPARDLLLRADTKPNRNSDSLRAVGQMQKPQVNRYMGALRKAEVGLEHWRQTPLSVNWGSTWMVSTVNVQRMYLEVLLVTRLA